MAKRQANTVVQLHLPERWPDPVALDEPRIRWALHTPRRTKNGVSGLAEVPHAEEAILVLPVPRVTFVRAPLPPGPPEKLAKLAPFAVEDAIVSAPEDAHAIVLDDVRDGERLVAVIDREWLAAAVREIEAAGFTPERAIVESALLTHRPDTWTVVWSGSGGFASLGSIEAIALDASIEDRPPLVLKLITDERRARGAGPRAVQVLLAGAADPPDVAKWSAALHVPVEVVGKWSPEEIDARAAVCPDLLPGAYGRPWAASEWVARLRPAVILAVAIVGGHMLLTLADWGRLAYEAHGLRAEMEGAFRQAFPEAKAVVDPALQMRRNLTGLRRAAGEPDTADLVPLLGKLAPALAAVGAKPRSLRYERGELQLELALPVGDARLREELASRLRVPGVRVRVERVVTENGAPLATVRVGPEGA